MKRETVTLPLSEVKVNEHNPRHIKISQMKSLMKSIQEFPEMNQLRPIVVDEDNVILGGNMRFRAMKQLGIHESEVIRVTGLSEAQKKEFIVKDNMPYGEWDWDTLANEWDVDLLNDWGLDVPSVGVEKGKSSVNGIDLAEMPLKPLESYDYIVLLFKNRLDFQVACEKFDIGKQQEIVGYGSSKVGIGRCIDGRKAIE